MKRVSQFWTHRFPIKSAVCFLFFSIKVEHQLHDQFRDGGFHVLPLKLFLAGMSFHFHQLGIVLVFDEQTDFPNSVLFHIQVPTKPPRTASPERGQQLDVRTNFVQEEPLDLQC